MSQPFDVVWSANSEKQHTDIDILVSPKEPVFACASGKIVRIGNLDEHGKWAKYIIIKHAKENYCTAYLHVKPTPKIIVGKNVKEKEIVGYVASMNSAHLHFNVWKGRYKKITMRGALPLPEYKKGYEDPIFPSNFIDPMLINYIYIS